MSDAIKQGQYIKVVWHDGQESVYRVAKDSVDGDVTAHRRLALKHAYAPWTAQVPRRFIVGVSPAPFEGRAGIYKPKGK